MITCLNELDLGTIVFHFTKRVRLVSSVTRTVVTLVLDDLGQGLLGSQLVCVVAGGLGNLDVRLQLGVNGRQDGLQVRGNLVLE